MKSVYCIGAVLMFGASIYGFVDYKKAVRNEDFKSMYEKEKKNPVPVVAAEKQTAAVRQIDAGNKIAELPAKTSEEKLINKKDANEKPATVTIKSKKRKKIDAEFFSRAPLRDIPEINSAPPIELKPE